MIASWCNIFCTRIAACPSSKSSFIEQRQRRVNDERANKALHNYTMTRTDAVRLGAATVILAMGEGRRAAASINAMLAGK